MFGALQSLVRMKTRQDKVEEVWPNGRCCWDSGLNDFERLQLAQLNSFSLLTIMTRSHPGFMTATDGSVVHCHGCCSEVLRTQKCCRWCLFPGKSCQGCFRGFIPSKVSVVILSNIHWYLGFYLESSLKFGSGYWEKLCSHFVKRHTMHIIGRSYRNCRKCQNQIIIAIKNWF